MTAIAGRCRNPGCGGELPAGATARRAFCSPACRQAAHRARRGGEQLPDAAALARLDTAVRDAAGALALAAAEIADLDDPTGREHHTRDVAVLPGLLATLLAAAVAHDRAAGHTWDQIGDYLGVHPDTARARWSRSTRPAAGTLPPPLDAVLARLPADTRPEPSVDGYDQLLPSRRTRLAAGPPETP